MASLKNLCELRSLYEDYERTPTYMVLIQQLYLPGCFPANLAEYCCLHSDVLEEDFAALPLNILSVGSGCRRDYNGLKFSLEERNIELDRGVCYTGLDRVE